MIWGLSDKDLQDRANGGRISLGCSCDSLEEGFTHAVIVPLPDSRSERLSTISTLRPVLGCRTSALRTNVSAGNQQAVETDAVTVLAPASRRPAEVVGSAQQFSDGSPA
jgi:hypothetical protein